MSHSETVPHLQHWLSANLYRAAVVARGEGSVFRRMRMLQERERQPEAELFARQAARLASMLNYAHAHSAFHRKRWPRFRMTSPADAAEALARLPLMSKSDLQAESVSLIAQPRRLRVTRKTTGGSTGQAVTVVKDRGAMAAEMAATWVAYGWHGVRIGDPVIRLWGRGHTWRRRMRAQFADFAVHRRTLSAFAFGGTDLERYWSVCRAFHPVYLYGYASMLEEFAQYLERQGHDARSLRLRSIVTTSEVLGRPQRDLLHRVFGCPVQNEYGCGEVGPIAYECEEGLLHVMTDNLVVELITSDGTPADEGEGGEVVLTDLNNHAMPLVRYRVGDFATRGPRCACGRSYPTLGAIWGREYDFVEDLDGLKYHGEFFMYLFEDLRGARVRVDQFQVVQRHAGAVDVSVVLGDAVDADHRLQRVRAMFADRLRGMSVRVTPVAHIPRAASGKMQVIRNEMRASPAPVRSQLGNSE